MKRVLSLILACALTLATLTSCGNSDPMKQYRTGSPWLCIDLEGVVTEDTPVNVKDDYGLYVNKDRLLTMEIPDGSSMAGPYADLNINQKKDITALFTGARTAEGHDAELAYILYDLYLDWDGRNAAGVTFLSDYEKTVNAIASLSDLNRLFIETPAAEQYEELSGVYIEPDMDDSSINMIYVTTTDLYLEDSAEYEKASELGKTTRDAKDKLVKAILGKMGHTEEEAVKMIDATIAFESLLAGSMFTLDEAQNPDIFEKIDNHLTIDELQELAGDYPIEDIIRQSYGYEDAETVLVEEVAWLQKLGEVYTGENLEAMKAWLVVHSVIDYCGFLDKECNDLLEEFQNTVKGRTGTASPEQTAAESTAASLPWAVARMYVDAYVSEEDKIAIAEMVEKIKVAYEEVIMGADFISEETKALSIEKLRNIRVRALYPDDWSDYECTGLTLRSKEEGGTLIEAILTMSAYTYEQSEDSYKEPVDKSLWAACPTEVNAFYNMSDNSVSILAAFARGELYYTGMSTEALYGGLGAVIGHEISHAFDANGSQYDVNGNYSDWWKEEDVAAFEAKNQALADYISSMYPWKGENFTGANLSSESCADMGGIKVMLLLAKEIDGFDYDVFFRTFANYYLTKERLTRVYTMLDDVHPMDYIRTNLTLQQFDEFLETYDIKKGDGMYLAPEKRVNIW